MMENKKYGAPDGNVNIGFFLSVHDLCPRRSAIQEDDEKKQPTKKSWHVYRCDLWLENLHFAIVNTNIKHIDTEPKLKD